MTGRCHDVSVVIPAFDAAGTLSAQLDALAAQDAELDWEVVVADNGSTDATPALVRARAAGFPVPLRVVDAADRRGSCHARNAGARASRGAVLLFCDADDVVAPDWVHEGHAALQEHDMVGGLTRELRDPFDPDAPPIADSILVGRAELASVISSNLGIRRETFFAAGGFDESLPPYGVHDVELSLRARARGASIAPAPRMQVYFRRTTDPRALARKVFRSAQTETLVWDRHPELFPRHRGMRRALTRLVTPPRDLPTGRGSGRALARVLGREILTRTAYVRAYAPGGVRAHDRPPRLLTPSDDPCRCAAGGRIASPERRR